MRKAAIGPIGDDIPSIFPIVAGVLLFLGTAIYASDQLDQRNAYLEVSKAGSGLSYVVLSTPHFTNDYFTQQCDITYKDYAERRRVNFLITLKKFCHYIDLTDEIFSIKDPYADNDGRHGGLNTGVLAGAFPYQGLACFSSELTCAGGQCRLKNGGGVPKDFQSFNFPVSVDCSESTPLVGLGMVNVVVWR